RLLATPSRQNYHNRSATPPRQNYHRSEVPMKKIKSTVKSLINEVNKLKSNKATTSNDLSEYVDVDDTETTG
ncbi:10671_t:CDS:2, partial [Gigaspora rosea]